MDKTPEILRQYAAQWPGKVILIEDASLNGGSAKQNFASILSWVNGNYDFSYFMFADQDDVWMNDKIEKTDFHRPYISSFSGGTGSFLLFSHK